ncbi:hypothetical protein MM213_02165 [Belliella sp. R4-6]|uniref:Uncharacterized protein n=1 Tax=Belliella alkalica TaxID=1730871 RepID=A0ABS9V778_9BACT|nr:hypothetical protein [Belliella alkalica]MCH7412274.1 hypothetical protein [Belliella alkalica]
MQRYSSNEFIDIGNSGSACSNLPLHELPENWFKYPYPKSLAKIAEKYFREENYIALRVHSAIIHSNYNFLINPNSKYFKKVKLLSAEPFIFDPRAYR